MALPRDIRRLAFQALFQMDAQGVSDEASCAEWIEGEAPELTTRDRKRIARLALGAFDRRAEADAAFELLAPAWPARRQAAVDRAILRLAYHEIIAGITPAKVAVNEAVELAKQFSTDRSPAFINALLDKILKQQQSAEGNDPGITPSEPGHAVEDSADEQAGGDDGGGDGGGD